MHYVHVGVYCNVFNVGKIYKCHSPRSHRTRNTMWCDSQMQESQFSSVTQSCPTLWDPMDCSTPGLPVYHQPPELTQTHVHWIGDAIQPSHPLSSPSAAFNLSHHQVFSNESALCIRCQSIRVSASASVLPMNIQDRFPLGWTSWISLLSKGLSRVFSKTTVQKHQLFGTQHAGKLVIKFHTSSQLKKKLIKRYPYAD